MKINPVNEMAVTYREIKPTERKELEINVQKAGAPSPAQEALKAKADEKRIIDDGRETIGVSNDGDTAKASREGLENVSEGIVLKKSTDKAVASEPGNKAAAGDDRDEAKEASKNVGSLLGS